jgi:hypothetical protein
MALGCSPFSVLLRKKSAEIEERRARRAVDRIRGRTLDRILELDFHAEWTPISGHLNARDEGGKVDDAFAQRRKVIGAEIRSVSNLSPMVL